MAIFFQKRDVFSENRPVKLRAVAVFTPLSKAITAFYTGLETAGAACTPAIPAFKPGSVGAFTENQSGKIDPPENYQTHI